MASPVWSHRNVADNVHDIIQLTDLEFSIVNGSLFNRLHYVYQDSTVFFVWPTARTQRYEHSLGTMNLAGQMFFNALGNADGVVVQSLVKVCTNGLVKLLKEECSADLLKQAGVSLYRGESVSLENFINNCIGPGERVEVPGLYERLVPSSVSVDCKVACMYLAQAIRLAGLLHDVGHPPMSHACEFVLKNIYRNIKAAEPEQNSEAKNYIDGIDKYLGSRGIDGVDLHEAIGNDIAMLAIGKGISQSKAVGDEKRFMLVSGLAAVAMLNDIPPFNMLHSLVSGTIDVDRLDYVQRDSKATAVGSDALQYGRITEGVRLMEKEPGEFIFAYPDKTVATVEDFLRKRLMNYKTIIFHHRVVKSEELLKSSIMNLAERFFEVADDGRLRTVERQRQSDSYVFPDNVSGLWQPLVVGDRDSSEIELSFYQWNDSWLLTMLRNECTRLRVDGTDDFHGNSKILCQLNELFFADKTYETVVKRSGDCLRFRTTLSGLIKTDRARLDAMLSGYLLKKRDAEEAVDDYATKLELGKLKKTPADPTVRSLRDIVLCEDPRKLMKLFRQSFDVLKVGLSGESRVDSLESFVKITIEEILEERGIDFSDVIVAKNHVKTGVKGGVEQAYFFNKEGKILKLEDVSAVASVLESETDDMPAFFTYIKFTYDKDVEFCHSDEFFDKVAYQIFDLLSCAVLRIGEYVEK